MGRKTSIIERILEECCLYGDEEIQSVFEPYEYVMVAQAIAKMLSFGFKPDTVLTWLCSSIEIGNVT